MEHTTHTETVQVVTSFRDATIHEDGSIVVARTKSFRMEGEEKFSDVEYENIGASDPIPSDLQKLLSGRLSR